MPPRISYSDTVSERILPADIDWIVAFTNRYAHPTRAAAGEEDDAYPEVTTLGRHSPSAESLGTRDLARVADRLFYVFDADSDRARIEYLDSLLSDSRPVPHIELDSGQHVVTWEVRDGGRALKAACALALLDLLAGRDADAVPLGTCQAEACVDVYVDRSRARSRLYCSTTCQTRMKVAAFRARQRQDQSHHQKVAGRES